MSSVLVLDSHVWVKFVAGASLSKRARGAIERAAGAGRGVLIPAISLWEIARLAHDGRLKLGERPERWFDAALATVSGNLAASLLKSPSSRRNSAATAIRRIA